MFRYSSTLGFLFGILVCSAVMLTGHHVLVSSVQAQEVAPKSALPEISIEEQSNYDSARTADILSLPQGSSAAGIKSLFFSEETLILIRQAIAGLNRPNMDGGASVVNGEPPEPGIRELALGGIVYIDDQDWTVWLNGHRITPDSMPDQIFNLNVRNEYIDIEWYDAYTNKLYPVRLRINERFNLDARLFMMGTHTGDGGI